MVVNCISMTLGSILVAVRAFKIHTKSLTTCGLIPCPACLNSFVEHMVVVALGQGLLKRGQAIVVTILRVLAAIVGGHHSLGVMIKCCRLYLGNTNGGMHTVQTMCM